MTDESRDTLDLEQILAEYIDRLNDGERLDPDRILAEHPVHGPDILEHLESFVESTVEGNGDRPLGTLGDYTLRRQIGRGGMGVVYEAWQGSMDRRVALKVLPGAVAADDKAFNRFMREARAAGKLNHPNVVGIHAMGQDESTPYYAMEFVEGETLAQILGKIKDAEPETETPFGKKDCAGYFENLARAFADVADGLQHAHSKGVIHRDIKPSNLILDPDGKLRILDFGLARLEGQESLTLSGDLMGTVLYMSPEQAMAKRISLDHRTDVYSLGATMYEVLTGRPPFRGKDQHDTLSQIVARDVRLPRQLNPRVPVDLETIVLKCLRKEAGDRYGTAEALGQDLRRFVKGDPVEARPEPSLDRLLRRLWRRRIAVATTCLVTVLLLILCVTLYRSHLRELRIKYDQTVAEVGARLRYAQVIGTPGSGRLRRTRRHMDIFRDSHGRLPWSLWPDDALQALEHLSASFPARADAHLLVARFRLARGEPSGALQAVQRALACDARLAPARGLQAYLLNAGSAATSATRIHSTAEAWREVYRSERAGDWESALEAYEQIENAVRSGVTPSYLGAKLDLRLGKGIAFYELNRMNEAEMEFAAASALPPEIPYADLLLGRALYLRGEEILGTQRIAAALGRLSKPERERLVPQAVAFYLATWDYRRAIEILDLLPDEQLRQRVQAQCLLRMNRPHEARIAAATAVDLDPHDAVALALLGTALASIPDERELGRQTLEEALKRAPLSSMVAFLCALGFEKLGDEQRVIELNKSAFELDPPREFAIINIGLSHARQGNFEEALGWVDRAAGMLPEDFNAHYVRGKLLVLLDRPEDALSAFKEASVQGPRFAPPHVDRGFVLLKMQRLEEAEEAFREAIRLDPTGERFTGVTHRIGLAAVYRAQGRPGLAVDELLGAIAIDSDSTEAMDALVELAVFDRPAISIQQLRHSLEALVTAWGATTEHPEKLATLAVLAAAASERENLGRAESWAKRAVERTEGNNGQALFSLAFVRLGQGRIEDARMALDQALELPDANPAFGSLLDGLSASK